MPELPEVEIVRRGLAAVLEGRRLKRAVAYRPNLRLPLPPDLATRLPGRRIERLWRRAKYLVMELDDGACLLGHLGMSGRMVIGPDDGAPPGRHDHVELVTEDDVRVRFTDPRRFGLLVLARTDGLAEHPFFRDLGPEPLEAAFTGAVLAQALAGRATPVKVALLDQTVVAGIGNIYAAEALFRARLSPLRAAGSVAGKAAERLAGAIKRVLTESIAVGGSSLRDHVRPSGELGYFQHHFTVYDREGQPCPGCTCPQGIRRIVQGGRSTFYCAKRQR